MTVDLVARVRARALDALPDGSVAGAWFDAVTASWPSPGVADEEHALGVLAGWWRLWSERTPGDVALVVSNPSAETHGWHSHHTCIDVIVDDRPFVVDSLLAALDRLGLDAHLALHPMIGVVRESGRVVSVAAGQDEALVHIEVDRVAGAGLHEIDVELRAVVDDIVAAVDAWPAMRQMCLDAAKTVENLGTTPDHQEHASLLRWMEREAFTFLHTRRWDRDEGTTSAGLSDTAVRPLDGEALEPGVHVVVTTTGEVSVVHRDAPLDQITVIEVDDDGVRRRNDVVGLFASVVYTSDVLTVPVAGRRARDLLEASSEGPSHERSRLLHTLRRHPREELLRGTTDDLRPVLTRLASHRDRSSTAVAFRRDRINGEVSCTLLVPRERFDSDLRRRIVRHLVEVFGATRHHFSTSMRGQEHARLHVVLVPALGGELHDHVDLEELRASLHRLTRHWDDELRAELRNGGDTTFGRRQHALLAAVPDSYRSSVAPVDAVADLAFLGDFCEARRPVAVRLHSCGEDGRQRLVIASFDESLTLSSLLPALHDLGAVVIDQQPHRFDVDDVGVVRVDELGLSLPDVSAPATVSAVLESIWSGVDDGDPLTALAATASMDVSELRLLRSIVRCHAQLDRSVDLRRALEHAAAEPELARQLVRRLEARLSPASETTPPEQRLPETPTAPDRAEIDAAISALPTLEADHTWTALFDVADAVLRTSHWAQLSDPVTVLKLDTGRIPHAPLPRPTAEIFVTGPELEGVHLRFGPVARGGLRYSDRPDDLRTEVLGLVKAQAVKNSVIVPVGAKGGFVIRGPLPGDRAAAGAVIESNYRCFVRSLLAVTDDMVDGAPVRPDGVRALDGDDPYLVVAADKGTATFSDAANDEASARGFWLDDAFASGGSAGYDHKALGITARGAWVSVQHHFGRLDVDVQRDEITVAGIGDMSGDVFGNGMLSSETIRLVAAFDHRHIVIDPDPDPAASYAERRRLFELPRSSWDDYDRSCLSAGAMIVSRSEKRVTLTPEAHTVLGLPGEEPASLTPDELISAVLAAPVDLIWNGGIGTYVKASHEQHADVGDRATDAVRIDATQLRCRVIGEGGNLGLTQAGRIEAALHGVRLNTDAIDNSGGVDCSDREVNLKILLGLLEDDGSLSREERNELLAADADAVCDLVLATNHSQNQTLTQAERAAAGLSNVHERVMQRLETDAGLDRALEALPTTDELAARADGLTRPELAVLLAHVKNRLAAVVTEAAPSGRLLAADPALLRLVVDDLPPTIRARTAELLERHPLLDAMVAKVAVNTVVDRGGITMVQRLAEETSASPHEILKAHLAAWEIFDLTDRADELDQLDGIVDASTQELLRSEVRRLAERAARWLLRHGEAPLDVDRAVSRHRGPIRELTAAMHAATAEARAAEAHQLAAGDSAGGLAEERAGYEDAFRLLDLADVATATGTSVVTVAAVANALDEQLEIGELLRRVVALPREEHWATLARGALRDEVARLHAGMVGDVLLTGHDSGEVDAWIEARAVELQRHRNTVAEIETAGRWDLAGASVAVRSLAGLSRPTTASGGPAGAAS